LAVAVSARGSRIPEFETEVEIEILRDDAAKLLGRENLIT
jgi:hypothetical protein